jgi:hypothetical protein
MNFSARDPAREQNFIGFLGLYSMGSMGKELGFSRKNARIVLFGLLKSIRK